MMILRNMMSRSVFAFIVLLAWSGAFSSQAFAACTSSVTNTSSNMTTPLQDTANDQCVTNSGSIQLSSYSYGDIEIYHLDGTVVNSGALSLNSNSLSGIFLAGPNIYGIANSNANILNGGAITGSGSTTQYGIVVYIDSGRVASISNTGSIQLSGAGQNIGIMLYGGTNLASLTNSGIISVAGNGAGSTGVANCGSNFGNCSGFGLIGDLNNSGLISSNRDGVMNYSGATINNFTNTGSIYSSTAGYYGIINYGVITNLNNSQGVGNVNGALTYSGTLPTNYNIIVNSLSNYGQLSGSSLSGSTTFGIYSGSTLLKGTYASVLTGFTAGTNVSATSGMFNGTAWSLVLNSGTTWDLVVQSSATNTLASVQANAAGLSGIYNQQSAAYNTALTYDCSVFDENNLCVSAGGRYTYASPSATNAQAGLVIVGYRPAATFRIGAFADQSVNTRTLNGFKQTSNSPMWGLFARWNLNKDGTGLGAQASAVNSASDLSMARTQFTNTEVGAGATQFNGQGYQLSVSYTQPLTDTTTVVPYLGLRYTRIKANAYTENTTNNVTSPLSYNAMVQNNFSAIGGVSVHSLLAEKLTGTASVGIQQSLKFSMDDYQGTSGITGLESFNVQMPGIKKSVATAIVGLAYEINKRERLDFKVLWQQQPSNSSTTMALATYTMGF